MSEEREKVYQILELGKHEKNLHHKKGFGGLLFIDLSMIKFSKLSSYIRQLDKENQELKKKLDYLRSEEYYNQLRFERDMLQNVVDNGEVPKEDKQFIDMTHRNTELLEQQKEFINYLEDEIHNIEPLGVRINYDCEYDSEEDYVNAMKEQSRLNTLKEILQKSKSIIGDNK